MDSDNPDPQDALLMDEQIQEAIYEGLQQGWTIGPGMMAAYRRLSIAASAQIHAWDMEHLVGPLKQAIDMAADQLEDAIQYTEEYPAVKDTEQATVEKIVVEDWHDTVNRIRATVAKVRAGLEG